MRLLEAGKTFYRRHRRATLLLGIAAAVVVFFAGFWTWSSGDVQYFTAPVEQGDIQALVNATGTINAVTTVQVGSQVSGMVAELSADFNSEVKKGEVVARIDPALFRTRVLQAEADLASAEAGVKSLEADLSVAEANLEKARAALREAELNLRRTLQLFEQGIASVEQRDSVQIAQETAAANRRGAEATFKVDSFPYDTFRGRVSQVRMNAYTVQNVVTYDTIIEFDNPDRKLLPGMTAYVTIPVASARDVVKIPNGALRFTPDPLEPERRALLQKYGLLGEPQRPQAGGGTVEAKETEKKPEGAPAGSPGQGMSEADRVKMRERFQNMSEEERARMRAAWMARRAAGGNQDSGFQGPPRSGPGAEGVYQILWKLNPDNSLQPVRVKTGLTDFTFTALLEGDLKPGDKVVIGQTLKRRSTQPFSGQRR